ncbi:hypothetical protein AaE_009252 [Aphanomyces astaci]|uniref:Peptidase C19 ubiquitin carboxyl-terminal hydrolase domain-containing protein n=1 Tax=Aphanomyces astaci TaxID=112090 RepID=A0A6A5A3P5_APHAT|nr:hypothetical protein AaE_009252 [Aphanomyces astaci]
MENLLQWRGEVGLGPGLHNYGRTCYVNAVLQCLLHLPPVVQSLLPPYQPALTTQFSPQDCLSRIVHDIHVNDPTKRRKTWPNGYRMDELHSHLADVWLSFGAGRQEDGRVLTTSAKRKNNMRMTDRPGRPMTVSYGTWMAAYGYQVRRTT